MKFLRRSLMLAAVLTALLCAVLLLNFTAPNPTGRRYSSETPLTTGDAQNREIGWDGERVLAQDLRLPNNNDPSQLQCFCRQGSYINSNDCNTCIPVSTLTSSYRIPDFVTDSFIAESKNRREFYYNGREVDQIADYVTAAILIRRPLWVYVRVNTPVAPEFTELVQSTGGDVVYYFTTPGYVDPVDQTARAGFAGAGILFGFVGWLELRSWRGQKRLKLLSSKPKPTAPPKYPNDPLNRAIHKTDAAADFGQRAIDRQRRDIDRDSL